MQSTLRIQHDAANIVSRLTLGGVLCSLCSMFLACSDESDPAPITSAGSAGRGGGVSSGGGSGAAGAPATGGASTGGAGGSASTQGGAGGVPATPFTPVVLFEFEPGAVDTYGWLPDPSAGGSVELVNEDRDPNEATPGALRFTAVFPPYDAGGLSLPVSTVYTYGDPTTGTTRSLQGGTRVHFWVRLVSPAGVAPSLAFFQPFIQGGAATSYGNNFGYVTSAVVSDNLWHEFILEVAGQPFMNDVWRVGLQAAPAPLLAPGAGDAGAADAGEPVPPDAGTDAGAPAPEPITFDIDYVWVE
jgi:hypothetical protein